MAVALATSPVMACEDINWEPPTEREDGTQLLPSEVDRYIVHSGREEGSPDLTIETISTSLSCKDLGLAGGTYYVWGNTVDTGGLVSVDSEPIVVTLLSVSRPKAPHFRRWLIRFRGR